MTGAAKTLSVQARKLSPSERLELVDDILASLDEPDPNIDKSWVEVAQAELYEAVSYYWRDRLQGQ